MIRLTWYCGTCDFEDVHEKDDQPPLYSQAFRLTNFQSLSALCAGRGCACVAEPPSVAGRGA